MNKETILGCLDGLLLEAHYAVQELEKAGADVIAIKGILDQIGAVKINLGHQTFIDWLPVKRGLPPMGVDVLVECDDSWMGIAHVRQNQIPILDIDGNHSKDRHNTVQWYTSSEEGVYRLDENVTRWAYLLNKKYQAQEDE